MQEANKGLTQCTNRTMPHLTDFFNPFLNLKKNIDADSECGKYLIH